VGKFTRWLPLNPLTLVTGNFRQAHRPQNLMNYLSVIIPTLNEELRIAATLKQIGAGVEIIVVDGGSTDKTREIAEQLGAKVIISPSKGRAFQMNLGAKIAKGDILLFLHGDTLLPHELSRTNYQYFIPIWDGGRGF
jgi:glycosyltransferase involved in cell wall biosynthesis